MSKTNYVIHYETEQLIMLRDVGPWDQYQTITNAAEEVVEEMVDKLNGRNLFYIDSEGDITEIIIENNKFKDFKII